MASVPETRGSSGNVGDVERGDHWPLTERQWKFLEVQRRGLGQVAQRLRLGLAFRRRSRLGVQGTEPTLGRGTCQERSERALGTPCHRGQRMLHHAQHLMPTMGMAILQLPLR